MGGGVTDILNREFLSTPSARRATCRDNIFFIRGRISIHALREEGDGINQDGIFGANTISIHALREEGDGILLSDAIEY